MIDVLVLNYNDYETTIKYVEIIKNYSIIDHILIVDNHSTDNSVCEISKIINDKILLIKTTKNGGYGYGNNIGVNYLRNNYNSKYIAISNPDVVYTEKCLKSCLSFLIENYSKGYAVVAPRMKNINGNNENNTAWNIPSTLNYCLFSVPVIGKIFKLKYYDFSKNSNYLEVDCVAGSLLIIDSDKFVNAGMYDENIFLYCEETVLGIKMKTAGYKSAILINEFFIHEHSVSINKNIKRKQEQNLLMWKSRLYVLNVYYRINPFMKLLAQISMKLCLSLNF